MPGMVEVERLSSPSDGTIMRRSADRCHRRFCFDYTNNSGFGDLVAVTCPWSQFWERWICLAHPQPHISHRRYDTYAARDMR